MICRSLSSLYVKLPDFLFLQVIESDGPVVQALLARRQVILDNIRDNDELGVSYQKVVPVMVACFLILFTFNIKVMSCSIAGNWSK